MTNPSVSKALVAAADALQKEELVIFPTETVYGLGADAGSDNAVGKIYTAKGRPSHNPLIVHFAHPEDIARYCELPPYFAQLSAAFWPGPLTMVLKLLPNAKISSKVLAGGNTLAVRVPNHPVAIGLIEQTGFPIAAPSANLSGQISPTCVEDISFGLVCKTEYVLDGGMCEKGVESTVINLTSDRPHILRAGTITKKQIETVLGCTVTDGISSGSVLQSPGLLAKHYAPHTPLRINAQTIHLHEAVLAFGPQVPAAKRIENLSPSGNLEEAAHNLYHMLHILDQEKHAQIAVMPIPNTDIGIAINDRLKRAAAKD